VGTGQRQSFTGRGRGSISLNAAAYSVSKSKGKEELKQSQVQAVLRVVPYGSEVWKLLQPNSQVDAKTLTTAFKDERFMLTGLGDLAFILDDFKTSFARLKTQGNVAAFIKNAVSPDDFEDLETVTDNAGTSHVFFRLVTPKSAQKLSESIYSTKTFWTAPQHSALLSDASSNSNPNKLVYIVVFRSTYPPNYSGCAGDDESRLRCPPPRHLRVRGHRRRQRRHAQALLNILLRSAFICCPECPRRLRGPLCPEDQAPLPSEVFQETPEWV
jgi:hypothetical protein